jgi:ubiquinone/menaquinone biosynthesis C-methylase UbiE
MFSLKYLETLRIAEIDRVLPLLPPNARVLEIGAGTGQQALELQRRGFDVTAIEIPDSNYAANRVYPIVDYDGTHIPLPDQSFDIVFSSNVLEHVSDLKRMHAEIKRVLKPSGTCIHILPTHAWRFWTTLMAYPHAVLYFASGIPELLPKATLTRNELNRLFRNWYRATRSFVGGCLPRRHGERGNILTELWLFHPRWWLRNFQENGFSVIDSKPLGLFYTGHMVLGARLNLARRAHLAPLLGSGCQIFRLSPTHIEEGLGE